jgi:hypothetical protein
MIDENLDFIPIPLPKNKKETVDYGIKTDKIRFLRSDGLNVKARTLNAKNGDKSDVFDIIDNEVYEVNEQRIIQFFYELEEDKEISMIFI